MNVKHVVLKLQNWTSESWNRQA